jgi:hypothetical protein
MPPGLFGIIAALLLLAGAVSAAPPVYDHVVIVIEENEQYQAIIGSSNAPYINSLAAGGVSFTNMRAIVHPSQPNYLELFSGSNQGVVNDSTVTAKFTTPNLGASLIAAGKTFAAYSDGLPAEGNITTESYNDYVRRHCPWVCWMPASEPLGPNQLPRSLHKPFTAFPSDFSQLPTVSFVIPNNVHNMHSASIREGDNWLNANLSAYAEWAKSNNSLLIVTWDEDSFQQANRIPTIFYGANLQSFANEGTWSLHNLLRTLEEMYGLPHHGRAAQVSAIAGAFAGESALVTRKFQVPSSGPSPVEDTMVSASTPGTSYGTGTLLKVQANSSGSPVFQSLVKFSGVFGSDVAQVPGNANIVSAKLILTTASTFFTPGATSAGTVNVHRMLVPWSNASTFTSLGNGVQANDVEAVANGDSSAVPSWSETAVVFDATESMRQFRNGAPNHGWVLSSTDTDDWQFYSSESSGYRPTLEVTYATDLIGFDRLGVTVAPGGTEATVAVHRRGTGSSPLSVDYSTSDGSAVAGSDYQAVTGTLNWDIGDTSSKTIVIPIMADNVVEGVESFKVQLSNLAGAVELDANPVSNIAISERAFQIWRFNYFGAGANDPDGMPEADPDHDGRTNYEEYVYAADPTTIDPVLDATLAEMWGGGRFVFTFRRNYAAPDLKFQVQISDDLVTWTDGCWFVGNSGVYNTPTMTQLYSEVKNGYYLTEIQSLVPSTTGRQFMRVVVTEGP